MDHNIENLPSDSKPIFMGFNASNPSSLPTGRSILPPELLLKILKHTNVEDLKALSETWKKINSLASELLLKRRYTNMKLGYYLEDRFLKGRSPANLLHAILLNPLIILHAQSLVFCDHLADQDGDPKFPCSIIKTITHTPYIGYARRQIWRTKLEHMSDGEINEFALVVLLAILPNLEDIVLNNYDKLRGVSWNVVDAIRATEANGGQSMMSFDDIHRQSSRRLPVDMITLAASPELYSVLPNMSSELPKLSKFLQPRGMLSRVAALRIDGVDTQHTYYGILLAAFSSLRKFELLHNKDSCRNKSIRDALLHNFKGQLEYLTITSCERPAGWDTDTFIDTLAGFTKLAVIQIEFSAFFGRNLRLPIR